VASKNNIHSLKKYFTSYWFRSAFYSFLQRFSITIFGLISLMLLLRFLTESQLGTWALFLAVTTIFETTKSGLLKNAHIKYVSSSFDASEKSAVASTSLIINAVISILFLAFVLFFGNWLGNMLNAGKEFTKLLYWFFPGMISMIFFSHFEAIQQSHFDFKGVFTGHLVRQLTFSLFIFYHFLFDSGVALHYLALYQSISIILGTTTIFIYSRKYLLYHFNPTKIWAKRIINFGGYIFGSGLISNIVSNLDQIMTATYLTPKSVAYYHAATRINGFVDLPSYAASEILFPKMSLASEIEGINKVRYLYEKMVSILLSIVIPTAIFVIIFPKMVLNIIAGTQYSIAAPILQLYMLNSILGTLQNQAANVLNSIGKPALCFKLNVVSLTAKIIITYICLVSFGFYGAAIGTLTTTITAGIVWYIVIRREIGVSIQHILKYILDFYKITYTRIKFLILKQPNKPN